MSVSLRLCSFGPVSELLERLLEKASSIGCATARLDADDEEGLEKFASSETCLVVGGETLEAVRPDLERLRVRSTLPVLLVVPRDLLASALESELPFDGLVALDAAPIELATALQAVDKLRRTRLAAVGMHGLSELGVLAAGVSHEIATPLSFVRSNLTSLHALLAELRGQVIRPGNVPDPAALQVLTEIEEALAETSQGVDRLVLIGRDLRLFSRQGDLQAIPTDLNACVDSALNLARGELIRRTRVARTLAVVPPVLADPTRVVQVLVNLLLNARDASSEGGEVRVVTGIDQPGFAFACIEDDGIGMDAELLQKAFEPFFTTKPPERGFGLGLPLSRRIAQGLGGELTAMSVPGHGSRFLLQLPVDPDATPKLAC